MNRSLRFVRTAVLAIACSSPTLAVRSDPPSVTDPVSDGGGTGGGGSVVCWDRNPNNISFPCAGYLPINESCATMGVGIACSNSSVTITLPNLQYAEPVQQEPNDPGIHMEDTVIPCVRYIGCRYSYVFFQCVPEEDPWYVNGPHGKKNGGPCPTPVEEEEAPSIE